jgi:hypothetical protein
MWRRWLIEDRYETGQGMRTCITPEKALEWRNSFTGSTGQNWRATRAVGVRRGMRPEA